MSAIAKFSSSIKEPSNLRSISRHVFAVSHLIPPPFTREVVKAFIETGSETRFLTTLTPDSAGIASRILRTFRAGGTRSLPGIPRESVECYPWREAMRLSLGRARLGDRVNDHIFHWARDGFDAWVARQLSTRDRLVYAHETECLLTFKRARAHGVRTVYDLPSPEHDHVENLLWQESELFPELRTTARLRFRALQAERTARRHAEFQLADVAVANSNYTRDTWAAAGLDGRKIVVVPYGAPPTDQSGLDGGSRGQGPLRLIWAGTFSVRKGAHYLLEAWRQWSAAKHATLDVFGSVSLPSSVARDVSGIRFHGPIPRDRLLKEYLRADALIFPTLCDGFGMVVNEALSRGLPVITTRRAGAADLIRDGENGRLIEHGSSAAILEVLEWCASNRDALRALRPSALSSAESWQWPHYRAALRHALEKHGASFRPAGQESE